MARLLVFDLDGTLVDSSRDLASATNAALARVAPGAPAIPLDVVVSFVGEGARLLVERCLRHAGVDARTRGRAARSSSSATASGCSTRRASTPASPRRSTRSRAARSRSSRTSPDRSAGRSWTASAWRARFARIWGYGDVARAQARPRGPAAADRRARRRARRRPG